MAAPPSSEQLKKLHPYQKSGPSGAYDSRQLNKRLDDGTTVQGLHVRVDMPGVSIDRLKVVKRSGSRTVTFTGKAPIRWPKYETSDRVYAGYVVLDHDPTDVDFTIEFLNGCLRLFFPRCDGSLHFLSPPPHHHDDDHVDANDDDDDTVEDSEVGECYISIIDRNSDSPKVEKAEFGECYITNIDHDHSESPTGIRLRGGRPLHINPYLLSGFKGIYEHKVVNLIDGEQVIYLRLDVPEVGYQQFGVTEYGGTITFSAIGVKEFFPFEGKRGFVGAMRPSCSCCEYNVIDHDITDGVIRILVRKASAPTPWGNFTFRQPPKAGEVLRKVSASVNVESLSSFLRSSRFN